MYRLKIYTSFLILLALAFRAEGRNMQRNVYDFDFIKTSNPWLTSTNAAGLNMLQVDRTSFVEAFFDKENGGLIPVEGSDNSWQAGAGTESFVRISDRIAFHGALSYSYFSGRNMGGHYLMDPSYNPINFLENSEDNPGTKVKELYSLLGGMSYRLDGRWTIGAEISYEAGDYAKRKDPRPRSRWMDLGISAGAALAASDDFSAGLNFLYRRTTEDLDCNIFGTTDQQYYTFVDYGGYFGTVEGLEGTLGYIKTTSPGRPMVNSFYGGALQLAFGDRDDILFFNELSYRYRTGHYGEKAPGSAIYCEFGGHSAKYDGSLDIHKSGILHRVSLSAEYSGLKNYENIYRRTTVPGGSTIVEYFGQNEILKKHTFAGRLAYTGYLGISRFRPKWEYGVSAAGEYSISRATYYPFYRDRSLTAINIRLYGQRNFIAGNNIFTAGLAADGFAGSGIRNEDGTYTASASDSHRTIDSYLYRDFEYDTAARVAGTLSFRYTRLFGDKFSAYIDVKDTYNHTLKKPEFLADGWRNIFTVTIGCAF